MPIIHYSFNVPFASDLAGPNTEDILHATADAVLRWTHPEDAPDDVGVHELPVHTQNLANLRKVCKDITSGPFQIEAHVISTSPKNAKGQQVTTVCLSGTPEMVHKSRETILNDNQTVLVGLFDDEELGQNVWINECQSSVVQRSMWRVILSVILLPEL